MFHINLIIHMSIFPLNIRNDDQFRWGPACWQKPTVRRRASHPRSTSSSAPHVHLQRLRLEQWWFREGSFGMQQPTIDILEWMQNKTQLSILDLWGVPTPLFKKKNGWLCWMSRPDDLPKVWWGIHFRSITCGMRDASSGSINLHWVCYSSFLLDACRSIIFPWPEIFHLFCKYLPWLLVSDCLHHLTKGHFNKKNMTFVVPDWLSCFGSVPLASFSYWR